MMTRERSGNFTAGSMGRTKPFSTTPSTAMGRRRRRWASAGDGIASGGSSRGASCGSAASCSSRESRSGVWASTIGVVNWLSLSVCSDHEDGRIAQLAENIRNLVALPIIPPDHPDSATRRRHSKHLEGAIPSLLKAEYAVERGFDFNRREAVCVNLLQVPLNPLKLPPAASRIRTVSG